MLIWRPMFISRGSQVRFFNSRVGAGAIGLVLKHVPPGCTFRLRRLSLLRTPTAQVFVKLRRLYCTSIFYQDGKPRWGLAPSGLVERQPKCWNTLLAAPMAVFATLSSRKDHQKALSMPYSVPSSWHVNQARAQGSAHCSSSRHGLRAQMGVGAP